MILRVWLFDEDGSEYETDDTIEVNDMGDHTFVIFEALQDAQVYSHNVRLDDLEFLSPHPDEVGVSSIAFRIREKDTHEEACVAGSHCSKETCRQWYSTNLMTMVNLYREES